MNIRTEFVYPPIPDRRFDWSAADDDTYDGPGCPIGSGPTEQAAVLDLAEQLEIYDDWPIEIAAKICPVFRAITGGA